MIFSLLVFTLFVCACSSNTKRIAKNNVNILNTLTERKNDAVNGNHGHIMYHTTFPYTAASTSIETIDLSQPQYVNLILPNYIAGVLLGHLIHEEYPEFSYTDDYLYGSLFAQLLQENISTENYPGKNDINNATDKKTLLAPGQGGPYQLNDYSKRLPSVNNKRSLGLINYTSLQGSLGYSIEDQDNGIQTSKNGPSTLDNIYFAPIAAAFFHYNDLNRLKVINAPSWGPEAGQWGNCIKQLDLNKVDFLDILLNATYNAGTYSDLLKTYVDLCANPHNELSAYIPNIDNYLLDDDAYIRAFHLPSRYHSLPGWYNSTTFIIYPRQIRFYIDQLDNNNKRIEKTALGKLNNSFSFQVSTLQNMFDSSMHTLAFVNQKGDYAYISIAQSSLAFSQALKIIGLKENDYLNFNNKNNRELIYKVIDRALINLENNLHFKLNETSETDHTVK